MRPTRNWTLSKALAGALALTFWTAPAIAKPTIAEKRAETIAVLKPLISKAQGAQRATLLFRLAELYWAQAQEERAEAMEAYERAIARGERVDLKTALRASQVIQNNAVSIVRRALEDHPNYARADELLFFLGQSTDDTAPLWTLIKRHPKSEKLADAYLLLGERFFENNELEKAQRAYRRALAARPSLDFALYKLAWCDYNQEAYAVGVERLREVVRRADKNPAGTKLRSEALESLARFYARVQSHEEAFTYFRDKASPQEAAGYISRLAAHLLDQGEWAAAANALDRALAAAPDSPRAVQTLVALLEAQSHESQTTDKRAEALLKTADRMVAILAPDSSWTLAHQHDPNARKDALALVEQTLLSLAGQAQRRGVDAKKPASLRLAAGLYQRFLKRFALAQSAPSARFFLAEAQFDLGRVDRAAVQYEVVAKLDPPSRYSEPAAWAWLLSLEKRAPQAEGTRLIEACRRFAALAKAKDPRVPKVIAKEAALLAKRGDRIEAAERYAHLIERWPEHKIAARAATLALDALEAQDNLPKVEHLSRVMLGNERLLSAHPKLSATLNNALQSAIYRLIQRDEPRAKTPETLSAIAARFFDFSQDHPRSAFADTALRSATLVYQRAGALDLALVAAEKLHSAHPRSKHASDNLLELARLYERTASFQKAAARYAEFAQRDPEDARAPDALINASVYLRGIGQKRKAKALMMRYVSRYPGRPDAAQIYLSACGLAAKPGRCYDRLSTAVPKARPLAKLQARYLSAKRALELGQRNRAMRAFKSLLAAHALLPSGSQQDAKAKRAGAHASFALLEPRFARYLKMNFSGRRADKAKEAEALACVQQSCPKPGAYLQVLRYLDPQYSVAALTRVGQVYSDMARALREAPIPSHLTPDQVEIYNAQIESLVAAAESKAIDVLEAAVSKASQLNVYSRWSLLAQEILHSYLPDQYPQRIAMRLVQAESFVLSDLRR